MNEILITLCPIRYLIDNSWTSQSAQSGSALGYPSLISAHTRNNCNCYIRSLFNWIAISSLSNNPNRFVQIQALIKHTLTHEDDVSYSYPSSPHPRHYHNLSMAHMASHYLLDYLRSSIPSPGCRWPLAYQPWMDTRVS